MPPTTITETSLIEEYESSEINNWTKYKFGNKDIDHKKIDACNNIIDSNHKLNIYDETRPKNEYAFMSPIRKWEKEVMGFETSLRWLNIIPISAFHVLSVLWLLHKINTGTHLKFGSYIIGAFFCLCAAFGVTAGAHRFWTHRCYKAKWPMQILLAMCFSTSGQNNIHNWVRDHRVHHKYSETSADPHNVQRGFFFAHVGWLMMKKHPDVIREGKKIDMSDINNDPIIRFHTKYFQVLRIVFCYVIPIVVTVYACGETWGNATFIQCFRHMVTLNGTWSVNSFAHLWGNKPYDPHIKPTENWCVSLVAIGEGWHNYHHTFPWDYKAAELPYQMNLTTYLLDQFAKLGWVYDLKQASPSLIKAVTENRRALHKE